MRLAKGSKLWVERSQLFGIVIRVSRREGWVDVRWETWAATWSERHYRWDPLLEPKFRREWTQADVDATRPQLEVAQ